MSNRLNCRLAGSSGPRVALLHGWGWDSRLLTPLMQALGECCEVVQPDLPGYGCNVARGCETFDDCVEQLMDAVPDAEVIVGWSLGGLLAMSWAARKPVRKLVLISASPRFMQAADWLHGMTPERFDAFADSVDGQPMRTRTRFAALAALGDMDARGARLAMSALVEQAPLPAPVALIRGLDWLRDQDLRAIAGDMACDVLCIHGDQDRVVDIAASQWMAQASGGRCLKVPGAAHLPWLQGGPRALCDRICADE
jgi:pimeloyl-[acyl-carrier protein] methyl ester esterase